jgi:hypothetical protein
MIPTGSQGARLQIISQIELLAITASIRGAHGCVALYTQACADYALEAAE